MTPQISIIIPAHNRPNMLRRALASVLAQRLSDWEVIIVDDGSQPPLKESLADELVDPRLSYHWQPASGPGAARRAGIGFVQSDLVCFLDDDDYYLPNHLTVLVGAYQQRQGIYAVRMMVSNSEGTMALTPHSVGESITLTTYWERPISLHPFAFPRQVVLEIPPVARRSPIEDFEWMVYLFAAGHEAQQLPNYTAVYVQHEDNRTNTLLERSDLAAREAVVKELYNESEVKRWVTPSAYRKLLTHQRLHWTRQCLRAGQWRDAVYGLLRTITGGIGRSSIKELAYTILTAWRVYWSQL